MKLTTDFIRALTGLSVAELADDTIDTLQVIPIAESAAEDYPDLSESDALYYKGYKAITIMGPALMLSIAEKVKDNFNEFSRFDNLEDMLRIAASKVDAIENPDREDVAIMTIVVPDVDPVTGEGR